MKRKWKMPLIATGFIALAVFDTVLAWDGSNVALVALASIAIISSFLIGVYGKLTGDILGGWHASNEGWYKTQDWGLRQNEILRDAIADLSEHDEEAATIHAGRAAHVSAKLLEQEGVNAGKN